MKALILLGRLQPESENKPVTSICSQMINQMLPSCNVYIHLNSGRWHNNWCIGLFLLVSFSRSRRRKQNHFRFAEIASNVNNPNISSL